MCGSLCTCIWRLRLTEEFLNSSPLYSLRQSLPMNPELMAMAILAQDTITASPSGLSCPPSIYIYWGAELQSYHLHRKFLTTEQSSPNPASCFWVLLDRLVEWVGVLFCFLLCSASEIHIYMYIKAPLIAAVV